jgi:hypothetical protein
MTLRPVLSVKQNLVTLKLVKVMINVRLFSNNSYIIFKFP